MNQYQVSLCYTDITCSKIEICQTVQLPTELSRIVSSYDQLLYRENVRVYDHSMDLDCLKKYIEFQKESKKKSEPFWNFYEYLYNNILYISNSNIIDQYEKNAHEIYNS